MVDTPRPRPRDARPATTDAPLADARRRRRVRTPDAQPIELDAASAGDDAGTGAAAQTAPVHEEPSTWPATDGDVVAVERGLRSIIGGGSSQVTPGAALRARDAARPRPADLARAEAELTIIRRHWTPRD
jgi:hypothetical protein